MLGPIVLTIIAVLVIAIAIYRHSDSSGSNRNTGVFKWFIPEYKRVGNVGEKTAQRTIESVMHEDDHLVTNVSIAYDGKPTELDAVIVNKWGVFIIEVKNYSGKISGTEDDYEWRKRKTTKAGNTYEKTVKNPIKQVKRQIYILAHYLDQFGIQVWVEGYAILLQNNSPVESIYLLNSTTDVDHAIHKAGRNRLDSNTIGRIIELLS